MKSVLLCIHGLGSSARAFDRLCAQPSLSEHLFDAPDLPGFGSKSGNATIPHPFASAHAFLLDYVKNIEKPLIVIGHSMGGALGLLLAQTVPEKVGAYISIEGNLIPEDCSLLSRKLADAESDEEIAAMKAYLIDFAKALPESWQLWAKDVMPIDGRTFRNYARDLVEDTDKGEWKKLFDGLHCPKLYMHGDLYKDQKLLTVLNPEIVRYIPESGHFTMQDQPQTSATVIADFIRQL